MELRFYLTRMRCGRANFCSSDLVSRNFYSIILSCHVFLVVTVALVVVVHRVYVFTLNTYTSACLPVVVMASCVRVQHQFHLDAVWAQTPVNSCKCSEN